MTTPTTEPKSETQFDRMEKRFVEIEHDLFKLRAFIDKHRDKLEQCGELWNTWGWNNSIQFDAVYGKPFDAKQIARLFGAEGWTRKPDNYSCGKIDWLKEVDGVNLKINGAEQIKPLLPEVKL